MAAPKTTRVRLLQGQENSALARRLDHSVDILLAFAAWQGYAADGHGDQSFTRVTERGGFSLTKLGYYLARAVDQGMVEVRLTDKALGMAGVWHSGSKGEALYLHPDGGLHARSPATEPKALLKQLQALQSDVESIIRERRKPVTPQMVIAYLVAKGWTANLAGYDEDSSNRLMTAPGIEFGGFISKGAFAVRTTKEDDGTIGFYDGDEWVIDQIAWYEGRDGDLIRDDIVANANETESLPSVNNGA